LQNNTGYGFDEERNKKVRKSEAAWSLRDDTVLRQMKANGLCDDLIADRLGRSKRSICSRWKKINNVIKGKLKELEDLAKEVQRQRHHGKNGSDSPAARSAIGPIPRATHVRRAAVDRS
jgi:hypothetical protein